MNIPYEPDLLGYVLGALDASEHKHVQQAIDDAPELEDGLLSIKNALLPLDDLETDGTRPGLARRTCELVANFSHPRPLIRFYDPLKIDPVLLVSGCLADDDDADLHSSTSPVATAGPGRLSTDKLLKPSPSDPKHVIQAAATLPADQIDNRFAQAALANSGSSGYHSTFSFTDLAVAVGFIGVLLGLLFPAVSYTRYQSRIVSCQNNLKQIGVALNHYSDQHGGRFVAIAESGPLSTVGAFAPILKELGLIEDDAIFNCAGVLAAGNQQPIQIPAIALVKEAVHDQLIHLQKRMSGHYGYTMGYCENGNYCPPRNMGRSNVVLVTDAPSLNPNNRASPNHGASGQNCLFEDGRVQFVVGETYGEDALFVNDYNLVAPGCRPCDNVIAPSHLSPLFTLGRQ